MSTIRGHELDAAAEIEVAGRAGYDALEPWFRKIEEFVAAGGKLEDLRRRIDDLTVTSARTGHNVRDAFHALAAAIHRRGQ